MQDGVTEDLRDWTEREPRTLPERRRATEISNKFYSRVLQCPTMTRMRDRDVRRRLKQELQVLIDDDAVILDELGVCQGIVRADVVLVNGDLHAFEIKSASDTLQRLSGQMTAYNRVFDGVTLVTCGNHLARALGAVPEWWGVLEASANHGEIVLSELRPAAKNPQVDAAALAELLWRDEAIVILEARGLDHGIRSKPRRALWARIASELPLAELQRLVRERLKRRIWRSDGQRRPDDATFRPSATSSDCRDRIRGEHSSR
jgi:hypothetical protein